ncbi:MAG TPA: hypothetical protein DD657_01580 [Culturomica sp.]|nr:hypothetical protein [Culturomica sp.]
MVMETVNLDGIRMNIFREIMKLDEVSLLEVYKYMVSRHMCDKAAEKEVVKEVLSSSVNEALKAQKEGRLCSTEIAMGKLDQEMQWK